MNTSDIPNYARILYKERIVKEVMDITTGEFGPYEIQISDINTTASRALSEIQSGETLNLFIGVTSREWEEKNLAIKIPIRRGILNYRLLAVNKASLDKFAKVKTLEDLQRLGAGMRVGWVTTKAFEQQSIKHFTLASLDGLYNMLDKNVIDYIPRGINEIYNEIDSRKYQNIVVEPSLVICMPAPTYIIVSPSETRLAKRIEAGLEELISNGKLKRLFYEFFGDNLKKANLKNRTPIYIPNPELPDIPAGRKDLWFNYDNEQGELGCK